MTLRQKNGWQGLWQFPGGTIHYLEKVEKAIKRIAQEELGIKVKVLKFLQYMEYLDEVSQRGYGHSTSLVFLCQTTATNFVLDDQANQVGFFKKLPTNTVSEHKKLFDQL